MPLRVSSSDAVDTFDVAEMTDNRGQHSQRNSDWSSSHQTGSANPRHIKTALSPTPEADDLTIDSSWSDRRYEETDRVGSIPPPRSTRGISSSNISVGSASMSSDINSSPHPYHSNHVPLYETTENLDEMQQDPRNPFSQSETLRASWKEHIPEEDEGTLSSVEDSTEQPQSQHYQNNQRSNPQNMLQPRPRQRRSDDDDMSMSSRQSSRQDINKKNAMNDGSSRIIQQLESQVAKLNFELATTKSSLDELQLENRRLNDDKDQMGINIQLLHEENHQLHLKIERLEKEKILRNMEGTKGVVRRESEQDSCVIWGGATVSGNTWAEGSLAYTYTAPTKPPKKVAGGDSLEVPFRERTQEGDYKVRPPVRRSNSYRSVSSGISGGDCASAHSVDLNYSDRSGEKEGKEQEKTAERGRMSLLNVIPSVRELTKHMGEASMSSKPQSSPHRKANRLDSSSSSQMDASGGDNDIGSNPQGEDFDDDPFATWSAPGDPKRKQENWLQRGLGGRGRDGKNNNSQQQQTPPPQSNEAIEEDPFDSYSRSGSVENNDKYTSFAGHDSVGSGSNAGDTDSVMQERKKFGLFGLGRRR